MLMVIFGAGASYDSASDFLAAVYPRNTGPGQYRPPLAEGLFEQTRFFRDIADKYSHCQPLIPELAPRSGKIVSIEEQLHEIQQTADDIAHSQIMAVRYYLKDLIQNCQIQWLEHVTRVTNYRALLNQIRRSSPVCFVTFNYDTMLETALADVGVGAQGIEDYIRGQFPVFKLHGSIDWECQVQYEIPPNPDPFAKLPKHNPILSAHCLRELNIFRKQREEKDSIWEKDGKIVPTGWIPALAIPVASKSHFFCPVQHVNALTQKIAQVDKILIVGWRATECHFLEILSRGLGSSVKALAVCGKTEDAEKSLARLTGAGINLVSQIADPGGFSDFIVNRRVIPFIAS